MVALTPLSYIEVISVMYTSGMFEWQNLMERPYIRKGIIIASLAYILLMWIAAHVYIPFLWPFYLWPYPVLVTITVGMVAIATSTALYLENLAFFVFLIGLAIFLFSYHWFILLLIGGATYIFYRLVETRRWKKIYATLEKSPEQLAKATKDAQAKKPRVEITFRGDEI